MDIQSVVFPGTAASRDPDAGRGRHLLVLAVSGCALVPLLLPVWTVRNIFEVKKEEKAGVCCIKAEIFIYQGLLI